MHECFKLVRFFLSSTSRVVCYRMIDSKKALNWPRIIEWKALNFLGLLVQEPWTYIDYLTLTVIYLFVSFRGYTAVLIGSRWNWISVDLGFSSCCHPWKPLLISGTANQSKIALKSAKKNFAIVVVMHFYALGMHFPSVLCHCWLGDRKGIRPVKNWMLICWWWWFEWSFARLIAPVVQLSPLTTSIILCFNKHRLTHVHLENGH